MDKTTYMWEVISQLAGSIFGALALRVVIPGSDITHQFVAVSHANPLISLTRIPRLSCLWNVQAKMLLGHAVVEILGLNRVMREGFGWVSSVWGKSKSSSSSLRLVHQDRS
jgi:hypothetical protein